MAIAFFHISPYINYICVMCRKNGIKKIQKVKIRKISCLLHYEKICVILIKKRKAGRTMTVLYVILAVVLLFVVLLLFVLLSPLSVRIIYEDGVIVKAGFSFIKIKVFPKKEKKEKVKKVKKEKQKPEKPKSQKNNHDGSHTSEKDESSDCETPKEKSSLKDTITLVYDIVKSVFEMLGKRATIRIDALRVVVSKAEAADTAVQFGLCSGVLTSLLAFTSNFGKSIIKDDNVSIEPDFVSGKSRIELDITLSARVIFVISGLVRGYFKNQSRK